MSDSNGPVRRRRIAGEGPPAAPAKKATAKRAPAKKAAAKKAAPVVKAPTAKKSAPVNNRAAGPAATPAPTRKVPAAKKSPAPLTPPKPPIVSRPVRPVAAPAAVAEPTTRSGPPRRELRWLVPAAVVAVSVLVLGAFVGYRGLTGNGDSDSSIVSAQRQAASAAATAAETIFSYQYDKLPAHLTDSKALMTPAFAKDFEKIAPALDEIAPQRKVQVKAVTRDAAALGCGDTCSTNKANILVFVDQARLVDGSKEPDVIGNRITVSMVKTKGTWLVNDIRAL